MQSLYADRTVGSFIGMFVALNAATSSGDGDARLLSDAALELARRVAGFDDKNTVPLANYIQASTTVLRSELNYPSITMVSAISARFWMNVHKGSWPVIALSKALDRRPGAALPAYLLTHALGEINRNHAIDYGFNTAAMGLEERDGLADETFASALGVSTDFPVRRMLEITRSISESGVSELDFDQPMHALTLAVWAVERSSGYGEAMSIAQNLSAGRLLPVSVTGQLAGSQFGRKSIGEETINALPQRDKILAALHSLIPRGLDDD